MLVCGEIPVKSWLVTSASQAESPHIPSKLMELTRVIYYILFLSRDYYYIILLYYEALVRNGAMNIR